MARAETRHSVSPPAGVLIAVDGVDGRALKDAARALASANRRRRASISRWGASGIFDELVRTENEDDARQLSSRTLLLLYAADIAFRLRWQIQPALAAGRTVIAAPYVLTAIAFGRAAGLEPVWLADLFHFALVPSAHHTIEVAPARRVADREGFIEFAWHSVEGRTPGLSRVRLMDRAREYLKEASQSHD